MKIVLLSPPYLPEYMRNARCDFVSLSATQWYPVLLGYAGAYLEGAGHEIKLIDAPAEHLGHEQTRKIVESYRPDLLVVYTGHKSEENDLDFADKLVESLKCAAVIVGPYASIDPGKTLGRSGHIDKLISGEFELPLGELASGIKLPEIKNLWYKDGKAVVRNPARPYLNTGELDAIPFVSRFFQKHLDIRNYRTPSELFPFMDIMTGRGCKWGLCTYCLWVHTYVRGSTYNVRSMANAIDEFSFIEKEMPRIKSVMLQDDTFTEDRAVEFCTEKIKNNLKIPWSCYARPEMGYAALKLMKKAGCRNLHVGYESASAQALRHLGKGIAKEKMTRFTVDAKRAGLRIHGDFLLGLAGETQQDAEETIRWAYELNPDTAQFQIMIPFPGTPYYGQIKNNGWLDPAGQPDMPQFTNEQIRAAAKKAYKKFYLSPKYLYKCLLHPYDHFFLRLKTISRAIPAMFWKRWDI